MKWIQSEKEKPPVSAIDKWDKEYKISGEVITFSDFGIRFGKYYHLSDHWSIQGVTSSNGINVTHWMIMPTAPDESPSSSSEEEAIGFAEWLNENRWYNFDNEKKKWCYTFEHGTSLSKGTYEKKYMKTSTELYNEYLKQSTQ